MPFGNVPKKNPGRYFEQFVKVQFENVEYFHQFRYIYTDLDVFNLLRSFCFHPQSEKNLSFVADFLSLKTPPVPSADGRNTKHEEKKHYKFFISNLVLFEFMFLSIISNHFVVRKRAE